MINYETIPDNELKSTVLSELKKHAEADAFKQGVYWENGKGCAVGCLLKSGNHIEYEEKFGVPAGLARLEDCIFEGLSVEKSKLWPNRFMSAALSVGNNRKERMEILKSVQWKFLYWILTEHIQSGDLPMTVRNAVEGSAEVIEPLTRNEPVDKVAARAAAYAAARAAADAAADAAARAAAYAAARAAARAADAAADAAAYAAAYAAARAARAARAAAAYAAAYAAAHATADAAARAAAYAAADAAADAAAHADYDKFANKLIQLIEESNNDN